MIDNKEIYKEVSSELNVPIDVVEQAYKSYFLFIRNKIEELSLKDNLQEDEFNKLRPSFNIPSIGKLWCDYKSYKKEIKHFKEYETKKD